MGINSVKQKLNFSNFCQLLNFITLHAKTHPFFTYLEEINLGLNPTQYEIYRNNYLFRTKNTIPSIAYLVIAAANNYDVECLALAGQNLFEETGNGRPANTHSKMLENSHNIHGEKIFGLSPLSLNHVNHLSNIINEAYLFVNKQNSLYKNKNYCIVLGAALAHETAASYMLTHFYKTIFLKYRNYYKAKDFKKVEKYFSTHLSGVEERHAQDMQFIANKYATNQRNFEYLTLGVTEFLQAQSNLWNGMHRELKKAENFGTIIPFNQ